MNLNVIRKIEKILEEANNDQELQTLQNKPQNIADLLQASGSKDGNQNEPNILDQPDLTPNPHESVPNEPNILDQPELTPNPTVIPDDDSGVPAALLKSLSGVDN
jgi:hypothetical protein